MAEGTPSRADLEDPLAEVTRRTDALRREAAELRAELDLRNRALGLMDEALAVQATSDPLTGLFTVREFRHRALAEWGRHQRHSRPLSLLLFGLDGFERLAALHGTERADSVLEGVGAILRARQRRHDVDCRFGAAELALLLPETSLEQAFLAAARIKARIEEARFPGAGAELRVTASVGVANAPEQRPASDEDLIRLAEAGKRRAERDGGARIVAVDPLDPERILRQDPP
jgi:diguanylate cyclase (GGDEF)-like protein